VKSSACQGTTSQFCYKSSRGDALLKVVLRTQQFSIEKYSNKVAFRCRFVVGDQGQGTDDYEIDAKLNNHVPEILPMNGKRVHVTYPGQPKLCRTCFCQGHIAKDCPDTQKTDFLDYVARLAKSELFEIELFGTWVDALAKYHPDYNRPNPRDLRQVMSFNQRGIGRGDLRRTIGYSTTNDLRSRIGYDTEREDPYQHYNQQPYRGGFRGARGRGRGRARWGNYY